MMTSEKYADVTNVTESDFNHNDNTVSADVIVDKECDCVELRNIKYKSMLLKKTSPKQVTKHNSNIDDFLEKERTLNKEDQWVKLDKSMKMKKMSELLCETEKGSRSGCNMDLKTHIGMVKGK